MEERLAAMATLEGAYKTCHPNRCITEHTASHYRHMLVTIRDPVDRFVSAFDWRKQLICAPTNESRLQSDSAWNDIRSLCRPSHLNEYSMLAETYHGDANELAEALCSDSQREEAQRHVRMIGHARTALIEHLGGEALFEVRGFKSRSQRKSADNRASSLVPLLSFEQQLLHSNMSGSIARNFFVPVPMEPPDDFEEMVDDVLEMLSREWDGSSQNSSHILESQPQGDSHTINTLESQPQNDKTHSSKARHSVLSERGACAVVHLYRRDYEAIATMVQAGACAGRHRERSCHRSMSSILNRRRGFLDRESCCV